MAVVRKNFERSPIVPALRMRWSRFGRDKETDADAPSSVRAPWTHFKGPVGVAYPQASRRRDRTNRPPATRPRASRPLDGSGMFGGMSPWVVGGIGVKSGGRMGVPPLGGM